MKDLIPAALRSTKLYNGKIYKSKDLLDHLILNEGFVIKQVRKRKIGNAYSLSNAYGQKISFSTKAEKQYIDKLLSQINTGAKVEMEHKATIEAIKKPGINTKDAAAMIAADHISEDKNYYSKLDESKLEKGGKVDRQGNYIGDGTYHSSFFVYEFPEFPQVISSISKSDTTESVYVNYINKDNDEKITVRFSDHENNATKFGDQLDGRSVSKNEILYRIGLKKREFVPNKRLNINSRAVSNKDLKLNLYEESNLTIQEMYNLGANADLSKHKGKLAKDSRYLILGDIVEEYIDKGRDAFGNTVERGTYVYNNIEEEYKLEKGATIQNLSKGTTLHGPSHKEGGIDIKVNDKVVAEAEGGEIVVNKNSSKLFCEELSQINEAGGGKKLDCGTCEHNQTCEHSNLMKVGGIIQQSYDTGQGSIRFMEKGGIVNDGGIVIYDFRPSYNTNQILLKNNKAYYAGMPIHSLKKETEILFGSKYIYTVLAGSENFKLGEIALDECDIETIKTHVKNIIIIPAMDTIEKANKINYKIGDEVIYKDKFGDYTLKSTIISILPSNTSVGRPLEEYTLAAGGAYTYDELKPAMAKGGKIDDGTGDLYSGSNASKQIKKELTEKFPGIKFSVRYSSYSGGDSVNASWNFGPTTDEVDSIIDKYQYGRFDGMTDSYEYNKNETKLVTPEGVVKNFGGVKYVSSSRDTVLNDGKTGNEQWENETSIQLLIAKDLAKLNDVEWKGAYTVIPNWGRDNAKDHAYRILRKNSFDTDNVTSYDGLESTGVSSGQIEDFYKIKYNGNKVTINKEAEKRIDDDLEFERTRPEREAKEKADKEYYDLKEAKNKKLLAELNIRQYDMLNDDEVSNRMENVLWPGSKLSTLDEYKQSLKEDQTEKLNTKRATVIKQVIIANDKDFNTLSNNLLAPLPYVWKTIGGTGIPDNVLIENGLDPDKTTMSGLSSDLIKKLLPYTYSIGTLVYNEDTKESFIADCHGYNYARYVGFPMDKNEVEKILLQIKVDSISKFEKTIAEIPTKDNKTSMPKTNIQPILNKQSDKYYLLMDYVVNNRIDYTKLPIEIHEQLDELLDITKSYTDKDGWEGILPEGKKTDIVIDKLSEYPHKIIRSLWEEIEFKNLVYENLIAPGVELYDYIMEKYPTAIISDYENSLNYNLFEDFADISDRNDLRNMTFHEFIKKSIENDVKVKIAYMVLENPDNYTSQEFRDASMTNIDVLGRYQTIIRGAIKEMYYDKKITQCVMSYNRVREIITSANLEVPKHYKLLSDTSCEARKSKSKNSNKSKIDIFNAKIEQEKQASKKAKYEYEAKKLELKSLKQKTKQSVKSVTKQSVVEQERERKIKIAKAKAQAQKQRIRILSLKK